jgi:hypothetical protein
MLMGRLGIARVEVAVGRSGVAVGAASWLDGLAFPCRAAQEVSVPDGSTPVGVVVIVV